MGFYGGLMGFMGFCRILWDLPSGHLLHSYRKSPFSMGKSTISMAIFHSYVCLPEGNGEFMGYDGI